MRNVYVAASCRTAIGAYGGSLKSIKPIELGATVIDEVFRRANITSKLADKVIMCNAFQAAEDHNPTRQAVLKAGLPIETSAMTVTKAYGSGLNTVNIAAALILSGQADCIVAGGFENMSQAPFAFPKESCDYRMNNGTLVDIMANDALTDVFKQYYMGITVENVAEKYGITRREQDEFALESQQKASAAKRNGKFATEIVGIEVHNKKGSTVIFDQDEIIREDTSMKALEKLMPVYKKDGTVTAGNTSGVNDGAAALLMVSDKYIKNYPIEPMARWICGTSVRAMPKLTEMSLVLSMRKAMQMAKLKMKNLDIIEIDETFAAQSLAIARELEFYSNKVNVNGGAIALGHPVGASGARMAVTLLHELKRRRGKYGAATLCLGGEMGEVAIFENCR